MTDIVTRLRLRDEQMVVLDHLGRPYGLAKSLEHEAADEIDRLWAALHRISLGSQNSGTTKEDLGREARTALGEGTP